MNASAFKPACSFCRCGDPFVMCHCRPRGANANASRSGFPACYSLMACPRYSGCGDFWGVITLSIGRAAKAGNGDDAVNYEHIRCDTRRPAHDRHAEPARQAQCLYRPDGRGDHARLQSRRQRRQHPRDHRHRRGPRLLRRSRRVGRRGKLRHVGQARRRRLRQRQSRRRPVRRGDLQLPKALDRGDQRRRRRRRHHHDVADGCQDRGQRRQDRLHLCPPRPRPGSRQRLVSAKARRPAAGVALVPLRPHVRCG